MKGGPGDALARLRLLGVDATQCGSEPDRGPVVDQRAGLFDDDGRDLSAPSDRERESPPPQSKSWTRPAPVSGTLSHAAATPTITMTNEQAATAFVITIPSKEFV